jgi:VIT1/CCC1 family predicted Fe2+/Mn2+ transporter
VIEHHHRNIQGGAARAGVFGMSDGLVTNVAVILGVAGAQSQGGFVRLAGLVSWIAGAFSMAAGEYGSMRVQSELLERELEMERIEIERRPELERRELAAIYRSRGVEPGLADDLATQMHLDPDVALETHAREELGIDPNELGSPVAAAVSSFVTFTVGAIAPLIPWFFGGGDAAILSSIAIGLVAAVILGLAIARFTERPRLRPVVRQLILVALPAAGTYALGSAVGISGVG